MGALAMRMLGELRAGRAPEPAQVALPVKLVVRASCGSHA
jgi:DNA-binding LacI/PurR family transcriptional regulator